MKICIANNTFHPFSRGGADRAAKNMADGFISAGHEVFVIATKPRSSDYQDEKNYFFKSFYYDLHKMTGFLRILYVLSDIFNIRNYYRTKEILAKEKADCLITHNLRGLGYWLPLAAKNLKITHIHILHDIQLLHPSGLMIFGKEKKIDSIPAVVYRFFARFLMFHPKAVISPSRWLMSEHERRGFFFKSKKEVMLNPIMASDYHVEASRKSVPFTFLYVGEITRAKGALLLADAFNILCQKKDDIRLIIIGQGHDVKRVAVNDKITFLGWLSADNVRKEMMLANCLVVPSLCYENSPTVICEAAAAGLPAIASNIGGASESAVLFNDILFTPGDISDLLLKMKFACDNRQKLEDAGEKARAELKKYSLPSYIEKIERIIMLNS